MDGLDGGAGSATRGRSVTSVLYAEGVAQAAMPGAGRKRALRTALATRFAEGRETLAEGRRGGPGRLWLARGPGDLAWGADVATGWTAAVADSCDALVVEGRSGWSALEPFPACWRQTPGACWLWRATWLDRFGISGLLVEYVPACTAEALERARGRFGWGVEVERADGLVEVRYRHPEAAPRMATEGRREG